MLAKYKPSAKYGVSDKQVFKVYDKVFARMRNFQPWPAKILPQQFSAQGNNVNDMLKKCIVFFYGTTDMGECTFANIFDYDTNKDKFLEMYQQSSKKDPRIEKGFEAADEDCGDKDDMDEEFAHEFIEFSAPLRELWEMEMKKIDSKKRKSRKSDDEGPDETGMQPPGYDDSQDEDYDNTEDENTPDDDDDVDYETNTRSRSRSRSKRGAKGRRAGSRKNKRCVSRPRSHSEVGTHDKVVSDEEDLSGIQIRTNDPIQLTRDFLLQDMDTHETNPKNLAKLEEAAATLVFNSSVITAIMPDGSIIELPVRPKNTSAKTITPAELSALVSRNEEYEKLRIKLEDGEIPAQYASLVSPQLDSVIQAERKANRKKGEQFLLTECELLDEIYNLQNAVTMICMHFNEAFKAIENIMELDVKPLMLKKNPYVVNVIKKWQNYDVSRVKMNIPVEHRLALENQAERLRCGADFVMEKFSSLFEYDLDEMNFYRAFYLEYVAFIKETRGVPQEDVLMLTD